MIFDNMRDVLARIDAAARKSGRAGSQVELVAVTKYADAAMTAEVLRSGLVRQIGESRLQDAMKKARALEAFQDIPKPRWRFIGHLQTNKARSALELFDSVDSLDSLRLAESLETALAALDKRLSALVQVKLTDRQSQSGIDPKDLEEFLLALKRFGRIEIQGFMAIAPMLEPPELVRPHFERLKQLFDRFFPQGGVLSMGMSRDFEVAVESGSTMVRVGSALFAAPSTGRKPEQPIAREGTNDR